MTVVQRIQQYGDNMDLTPYMDNVSKNLRSLRLPQRYTAPIYAASTRMYDGIQRAMQHEQLRRVGEAANEVYQQVGHVV